MVRYLFLSTFLMVFLIGAVPFQPDLIAPCSVAYGAAPSQPIPTWLQVDATPSDLATQNRYELLVGHLLKTGIVNGSSCPSRGMNTDGSPNGCGLNVAQTEMVNWQNRYDATILAAAQASNVPPRLMKAVIAVESQFWPAPNWIKGEIGLGQMTEFGADLLLSQRSGFYRQVCTQALSNEECTQAYPFLADANRAMLRGLVLRSLDATCVSCQGGIDPGKGEQAVKVLAETMAASCTQSARTIQIATGKSPSSLMSYEDFWRFTLANYHSGSGCMYRALRNAGNPTSWSVIAAGLPNGCSSGSIYVRRVEENIKP
jgi:hypothetical protein